MPCKVFDAALAAPLATFDDRLGEAARRLLGSA
jgi:hypothetical protein